MKPLWEMPCAPELTVGWRDPEEPFKGYCPTCVPVHRILPGCDMPLEPITAEQAEATRRRCHDCDEGVRSVRNLTGRPVRLMHERAAARRKALQR